MTSPLAETVLPTAEATVVIDEPPAGIEGFEGTFTWVDPRTLVVDPYNHRKPPAPGTEDSDEEQVEDTTEPDPELIASVREIGVQTPLLLRPQSDGKTLGIIFGQRRFKAATIAVEEAIAEGRTFRLVPAIVRTDLRGVDDAALTISLIENAHRKDASTRDSIAAVQQLSLMKISKTRKAKYARSLGLTVDQVKASETAIKLSDKSLAKVMKYDFDFVEMADFHEVEDVGDALWQLKRAKRRDLEAGNGEHSNWAHAMQGLRDEKKDRDERVRLTAELTDAGVPVVERRWSWVTSDARPLTDLTTADGEAITPEDHRSCPGHAAFLDRDEPVAVWLFQDWATHEHHLAPDAPKDEREQESKEEAKEVRRTVILNNKAWRAARVVRQEFLATLCSRKGDASPAAWALIMSTMTGTSYLYSHFVDSFRTDLVASFLRVPDPNEDRTKWHRVNDPFGELIAKTPPGRRWRIFLAHVAAAYEQQAMGDSAWRGHVDSTTTVWLRFLRGEGYPLSEFEAETLATAEAQERERAAEKEAKAAKESVEDESEAEPAAA
ncbi:ParB/RepB/Spo0J family partition protein [Streptomyces sp. NPDC050516]|uniref:ParB/RepB/Spo0J family partition protein n=1 Tax=Streptomyces sp. NPDC050516 TaxID=3365621 RepID=UPI00378D2C7F